MIARANEMKIDTSSFAKELEKVTSTLIDAKAEIDKAKARYDSKEYSESKKSSSASLEITEKHLTLLQNVQYNIAMATKDVADKRHSNITSLYNSAVQTLESTKAKMTGEAYVSIKGKLDVAKTSLDKSYNMISQGNSYLGSKNYYDAVNSYRSAYSELSDIEVTVNTAKSSISESKSMCSPTLLIAIALLPLAVFARKKSVYERS